MGLTLVTGPANSGRAGEVLGAYRARLAEEPILVVPAFRDVEHTLRELAGDGAVFGTTVVRFGWLFKLIAERCGAPPARIASETQRDLLIEETVRSLGLRELRESAEQPGFARAAGRLIEELERAMVEPAAFESALEQWAGHGPRRRYAREVASLYSAYRERLEAAGLVDEDLYAWRAVDALRERPDRFGTTPVLVYGFDDFTPIELDALETLAGRVGVDVTVSLPYEPGREAFRAVAPLFQRLSALATRHVELPAISDWYADESREALHQLERRLYEGSLGERADPGGAIRLLTAGGERAEVEQVAAEVLALLRGGVSPGDVAIVFRSPRRYASLVEQVLTAYGVPFTIDRYVPFGHTALGRGLLALLRCATGAGTAEDLLAYLRTPGLLDHPRIADRLEADVRREGAVTAAEARKLWEQKRWKLAEIDRLRRASGAALVAELHDRLGDLFARSYQRRAHLFASEELEDPRALRAGRQALKDMHALALADPGMKLDHARVRDRLERIEVQLGEGARPDRMQVAAPEAVRARRFEAVFVCGLQEAEFPRPETAEPFLSDDDRRAIAAASGLVLAQRGDTLDRERHLFYVCCSRAERLLGLSSRFADEQGAPQVQSFLLEEVRDLFDSVPVTRRSLSDVTWPLDSAPTEAEWERAFSLASNGAEPARPDGLHDEAVLEQLAGLSAFSASALEAFSDCPVKWLVDRLLKPDPLEPDPEPLVRGSYAHAVLEATYRGLRDATGSAKVTPASLGQAESILLDAMRDLAPQYRISPKETRFRTAVRRLEFDLLRHLRREADRGGVFEPSDLELSFGMDDSELPALSLGDGVEVRGKIDRLDRWNGYGVVTDYKSGRKGYPVARWEPDRRMQAALYMLAVRELLGLQPGGGVYVPLADKDKGQPRGLVLDEVAAELGDGYSGKDVRDADGVRDELERVRSRVREIAGAIRGGEVRPCPDTCAWNGGCSYPSICREEG